MIKRILVPTDDSRVSRQSARAAVELARNQGAFAPFIGLSVTREQPAIATIDTADRRERDLIFIGSHNRTGLGCYSPGRATTRVLALTRLPVFGTH